MAAWKGTLVTVLAPVLAPVWALALVGCEAEGPRGLAEATGDGPGIVFDVHHKPQPEIPFPNDLGVHIRTDGTPRLNVSLDAPTALERRLRKHMNELDGFSGLTPITLAFDGPLDVTSVTDDTVFVVNIQPGSKRFGERMKLDLGRGWFPHQAQPHAYVPLDPYKDFDSYVLPPDNRVDTDGDGTADKWVYHYEVATHTLDIRPLMPLEAGAQYAVVLTSGVKGWTKDGRYGSIRSPFGIVNHDSQTADLERALPFLEQEGVQRKDIAFAWTLTTGDLSRTFRKLRDGLYGEGPFAWLAEQFPARINDVYDMEVTFDGDDSHPDVSKKYPFVAWDHTYTLQGAYLDGIFKLVNNFQPGIADGMEYVSHAVFGDFVTPDFRATVDNVWQLDLKAGKAQVAPEKVPFLLIVPKATPEHQPPFPVVIYAHATGTSRIESLLLANRLARAGIATFAIDAVGHGPVLADPLKMLSGLGGGTDYLPILRALLPTFLYPDADTRFPETMSDQEVMTKLLGHGFLQQLAVKGRAVDDDGDCQTKGGEAYYAPDAFRLRDAMRQTTLDYIVAVRMLRSLGQVPTPPADPRKASAAQLMPSMLAGDFDCDGKLDVGGQDVPYFMTGVSLGGIHTALTSPLEPHIVAAAAVVPGAGLADIFMRTKLHGVVTPLMHKIVGPRLVACPQGGGVVSMSWNDESDDCKDAQMSTYLDPQTGQCLDTAVTRQVGVASATVPPGARVVVRNLDNGETEETVAAADGSFALAVASDKGDRWHLQVFGVNGNPLVDLQVKSPHEGLARKRNTPEFRRFVQIAANVLEGADAITVADRVLLDPLPGYPAKNMLMMLSVGDQTVPFTTGVSLARATGLFGRGDANAENAPYRAWTEAAIAAGLLVGKNLASPPLLDPSKKEGIGYCRTVPTVPGQPEVSALCLADVQGHHEYIAQPKSTDGFPDFEARDANGGKQLYAKGSFTEYHRNLIVSYFHALGRKLDQDACWADPACVRPCADKGDCALDLRKAWEKPVGVVD